MNNWCQNAKGKALGCQVGDRVLCDWNRDGNITEHTIIKRVIRSDCGSGVAFVVSPSFPMSSPLMDSTYGIDSGWFVPAPSRGGTLLPCPCCGGFAAIKHKTFANPSADTKPEHNPWVECLACGLSTKAVGTTCRVGDETWDEIWARGIEEVVALWNARSAGGGHHG